MAFGVEEYNEAEAWARLQAGFKGDAGSSDYNKPPELRFVSGELSNYSKIAGIGKVAPSMGTLDPWVTRYPGSKLK